MKIRRLVLYKTSLDREYQNVIDTDPETKLNKNSYKTEVLDAYYNPLEIYNGETKAIKEIDGDCVISISNEYEYIMGDDYNYAAIYTGRQWFFYFIIGMESMNDGVNPSMLITLERDAWSNNIEELTNHKKTDYQQVIRSHFERVYTTGNNRFYPYYIPSNDSSSFTSMLTETYQNIGGGGNVIWCGVRFSKDTIVEGSAGTALASILENILSTITPSGVQTYTVKEIIEKVVAGESLIDAIDMTIGNSTDLENILNSGGWKTLRDKTWTGASTFEAGAPMFYFPCAIISGVNDGIPDYVLNFTCNYSNGTGTYDFSSSSTVSKIFSFESEEIIETTLTTMPPFGYTVSGTTISAPSAIATNTALRNSSATKYIFPYPEAHVEDFLYVVFAPTVNNYKDLNYTYTSPLYGFEADDNIGSKFFDPRAHYNDVKEFEPRIYCAPFTKLYSTMGQAEVEIPVVQDRVNITNRFLIGNKTEPMMSTFLNGKLISGYNSTGTPGSLPTSYAKRKDFILGGVINMGSTIIGHNPVMNASTTDREYSKRTSPVGKIAKNSNNLKSMSITSEKGVNISESVTRYNPASTLGGVSRGIMSTVQSGVSTMGQATRATVPSVKANNNIEKFIPKIIKETFTDIKEMEDILGELYLYGYKYPEVQSIKNNCRVWFDYCETSMCSLPNIKNYIDRERLESAFDRGVTKWHYGPFGLQHTFLKNLNNVERQFVSAVDSQIYYKFYDNDRPLENLGTLGDIDYNLTLYNGANITNNGLQLPNANSYGFHNVATLSKEPRSSTVLVKYNKITFDGSGTKHLLKSQNSASMYCMGLGINSSGYLVITGGNGAVKKTTTTHYSEIINKTLALNHTQYSGSSSTVNLFLDGTLIGSYSKFSMHANNAAIGPGAKYGTNVDASMCSYSVYYYDEAHIWTEDEAKQHMLPGITYE